MPIEDAAKTQTNPAYLLFQRQDKLLLTWILASMTPPILTKIVGLRTSS